MGKLINISIDVTKIDKNKIKKHTNGSQYYNIVVDEKQTPDQFNNTHTVYEAQTKEEREAKVKKNYLGSGKEFVFGSNNNAASAPQNAIQQQTPPPNNDIDNLPF